MKGAIVGDIIGSRFEWDNLKSKEFTLLLDDCRFTDDSVLTIAVAEAILTDQPYEVPVKAFARRYPDAGYGGSFFDWMQGGIIGPYNSWGNGSAMRVSAVGYAFDTEEAVLREAKKSAEITHSHPEGIKGAQAVALGILLARQGASKQDIRAAISHRFGYDLDRSLDDIRPGYRFDVSCQGSVPEAIIAFLESNDYEDAVRGAISIGGDSDTIACIAGGLAAAFYGGVPAHIEVPALAYLTPHLMEVVERFEERYLGKGK